jgi:beta-xylosidase
MKPFLLALFTLTLLFACTKSTKKMFKNIAKYETVQLFVIDEFATAPEGQDANETYLLDYQIFNQIALTDSQQINIKSFVTNSENYTDKMARTCPFIGQFGLSFTQNGKVVRMIVGHKNCPKCLVSDNELEDGKILDFLDGGFVVQLSTY